jgi:hypothetical protein
MKTPFSIPAIVGLLALAFASSGWAAPQDPAAGAEASVETAEPAADPMQQIPHTLKALEDAKAGKYGKLKSDDRRRLETAERHIQALKQRNPDLRTLNEAERVQLFNSQEAIIAIVDGLRRSQLVCTYKQEPGTRFKTKHCMTRDMAEAVRRAARESTKTAQRDMCVPGEGNPCQPRQPGDP